MTGDRNRACAQRRPNGGGIAACLAVTVFLASASALAQEPEGDQSSPPQTIPPQGVPQQPPAFQPGFLDALGRWIGDSKSIIDEGLKSSTEAAKDAAKDAAGAAGQATGAIFGLPGTRVVMGRERCQVAANGGADCAPAANALCRSKGFGGGRGVDINSAQKCPSWMWLSGRQPPEGSCPTETFVTRAVCR